MSRLLTHVMASSLIVGAATARADETPTSESSMQQPALIEVWIVLSEPALSTLAQDATQERTAQRERIVAEQDRVMTELKALGAIESGRTQQRENALAVQLPAASLEGVKKIDGVVRVRSVSHRNRIRE